MMPLGTNDESLLQRWGYALQRKGAGTRMDFGDYLTLAEEGKIEKYSIVIWLEGEDPECVNDVLGGVMNLEMNFEVLDED